MGFRLYTTCKIHCLAVSEFYCRSPIRGYASPMQNCQAFYSKNPRLRKQLGVFLLRKQLMSSAQFVISTSYFNLFVTFTATSHPRLKLDGGFFFVSLLKSVFPALHLSVLFCPGINLYRFRVQQ